MNYLNDIHKLIENALIHDTGKVRSYSNLLATKLEQSGESKMAARIRKTLANYSAAIELTGESNFTASNNTYIPYDQESRLELAEIVSPQNIQESFQNVFLSTINEHKLNEFIDSHKKSNILANFGLESPTSVLLYGPPGCGKTITTKLIAKEIGLPLIIVRLDTMISSYLGNTSKNIRKIFDYASKEPCILFLDELDAIAKLRDDQHELGELKRVVNSLLQNIDDLNPSSLLIAATNHEKLLDKAIWRRFSTRFELQLPTQEQRLALIHYLLTKHDQEFDDNDQVTVAQLYQDYSLADIKQIVQSAIRKSLLKGSSLVLKDFTDAMFDYINEDGSSQNEAEIRRQRIQYLLDRKSELTNRALSDLLGCHHSTIGRDKELLHLMNN